MSASDSFSTTIAGRVADTLDQRLHRRSVLRRMGFAAAALMAGVFGGASMNIQAALACVICTGHPEMTDCNYGSRCRFSVVNMGTPMPDKICLCSATRHQIAICRDGPGTSDGQCYCECKNC